MNRRITQAQVEPSARAIAEAIVAALAAQGITADAAEGHGTVAVTTVRAQDGRWYQVMVERSDVASLPFGI